jgi:hypothetical protein
MLKIMYNIPYIELDHNNIWKLCKTIKSVFQNTFGITQKNK